MLDSSGCQLGRYSAFAVRQERADRGRSLVRWLVAIVNWALVAQTLFVSFVAADERICDTENGFDLLLCFPLSLSLSLSYEFVTNEGHEKVVSMPRGSFQHGFLSNERVKPCLARAE